MKEQINKLRGVTGIYSWFCNKSGKYYVGSSVNIGKRVASEYNALKSKKIHNHDLQNDWDVFGEGSFSIAILESCEELELLEKEVRWIKEKTPNYNKSLPICKMLLKPKDIERFWTHVAIKDKDDCWEWTASKSASGYGRMTVRNNGEKFLYSSHRLSFFITNPEVNEHSIICHKCDNPGCCNPNHLFAGSSSDNSKDRRDKNRKSSMQILSKEDIPIIRNEYLKDVFINKDTLKERVIDKINKEVSATTIMMVARNKIWIDKDYSPPPRNIKDVGKEIFEQFYNSPDVSHENIRRLIFDKYKIRIGKEGLNSILNGRQSKFERNKKDKPEIIQAVIELKSQGMTHGQVVKYLEENSIIVSHNTICRILAKHRQESV